MKYQIPLDLIDQIQINLNNESNLSSFNQLNSSIPPLPTIEQAISSIDLSSDNLKCNNCIGSFLRGFESLICIYCGQNNQQKSIPQSIPFKSTIGFRLLLDSLGLDPSQETVGSPSDHVQSNQGQTSLKDEISLADLLDLDLKWPDEFSRNDVKKVEIYPKKGFLNLVGEDFAEGSIREHASRVSIEQQVTIERTGNNESAKFGEQNTESYAAVLRSADGEQGESSAWEAEFQSANQSTAYDNLQSSNVSILPSVAGGIDGDSMSLAPPESNLTDANHSSNSGPVNSSKLAGSTEDLDKNSSVDPPNDEKIVDDNAIDEWGEFSAVAGPENNHSKPSSSGISGGLDFSDAWNDFSGSVAVEPRQLHTEINKMPNDESLSLWNNLASESKADDIHLDSGSINMNQHVVHHDGGTDPILQRNDFAFGQQQDQLISQTDEIGLQSPQISQDDPLHDRGINSPTHIVAEAGDSFDFWNDFKSSTIERHETSNIGEDDKIHYGAGDSKIDAWNDIASSSAPKEVLGLSSAEVVASDRNGTHDDSLFSTCDNLGAWNNFTGSTVPDDKPIGVDHSSGPWNDLSYLTETHADQHQGSGTQAGTGHTTFGNDGLLDSWSDFRTSNTQVGNSIPLPNITESTHDQISVKTGCESQRVTADNDETLDLWGDFGPSTLASKTQSQTAGAEFSEKNLTDVDNDFFNGWNYSGNNNGVTVNKGTSSSANDDAFDSWSEFASPINIQAANASDPGEAVKLDDPFGTWKTFSSSSEVQTHGDTAVVNESASESNLFETGPNLQGMDSSSFMQVDQLFGTVGDKKCSSQTDASLAPEVPDLLRMENGDVKADNIPVEVINQSECTTKPSQPSSSDVETLISEMHDLSFMLETTLTVPSSER